MTQEQPAEESIETPCGGPAPLRLFWEEPFRVFFLLAVLATLAGVLLWPLHHEGVILLYPGTMHARVMTVGLAGVLIGFLGTALPRLVEAPMLRWWEASILALPWLGSLVAHLSPAIKPGLMLTGMQWGDGLFGLTLVMLLVILASRWFGKGSSDTPPPGFPVALAGLIAGAVGAGAMAWKHGVWLSGPGFVFAKLLLYQGLTLLPLLGVAPFLLPRFFGSASRHRFDESPRPPAGWWPRFWICSGAGLLLLVSFGIEAGGHPKAGLILRGVACAWVFLFETPVFRRASALSTPGSLVRWSLLSLLLGLGWAAFDPLRRVGILHLFFVSGIGLVMLATGTRVVLGHAGRHDLLGRRMWWLVAAGSLVILAAATRVSAEFLTEIRLSHLDYAAYSWVAGALLWLWMPGRFLFFTEPEEENPPPPQCRKARGRS